MNLVSILMGSLSDRKIMRAASDVLDRYEISHSIYVLSAHRTPDEVREHVHRSVAGSIRVFIVGAGMAAHLAGVVASYTALPVIGVPLSSKNLDGKDALYSTVQMPPGIPVATVAINGAKNAAILAVQILGTADDGLRTKVEAFRKGERKKILSITQQAIWED